jgi:CheY-like chemotaxis protein
MGTKKRILCISYDESLLTTRKMILEQAGFDVVPAFGFAEAGTICRLDHNFDLIVMGHSMPRADKTALIEMLKPNCVAPVLSVRRHIDAPLPEAQFSVDSHDGPDALIAAVKSALGIGTPKPVDSPSAVAFSSVPVGSSSKRQERS